MPFDSFPERVPSDGDYWSRQCKSCKRPIAAHESVEEIRLAHDPIHRADIANGTYHTECAKPLLSLVGTLDMLSRWG